MPNSDLLPSPLSKINENQPALEAAIMELTNWVEQWGRFQAGTDLGNRLTLIKHHAGSLELELTRIRLTHIQTPQIWALS
ncbi:hypothetical protein [Pseudomonas sp. WMBT8]|uniref:hypothetical protein n=1 Tax=Pseudomonas sp. WMBT8 TaxID=3414496 RepID=UPI003D8055BE